MEVYVDDILVKSIQASGHILDQAKTLQTLRRYGMKLNPAKYAFGVSSGKFLGFVISQRGNEANPKKVQSVLDTWSPENMKQLQQLNGWIAALNKFISWSMDKCLPFFRILRKTFVWGEECEEAFNQLKLYLRNPLLLSKPEDGEPLYLYLAVLPLAVSLVLLREDGGTLRPVYFTRKAIQGAEGRYPRVEKLALALIVSARRLRPYFQAHSIWVLTEHPLKKILQRPDIFGRLVNWAIEFGNFDIEFHPRTTIKGQALVDFLREFNGFPEDTKLPAEETWVACVDGSSNQKRSGVGSYLLMSVKYCIFGPLNLH
jgi:hypothetical protein